MIWCGGGVAKGNGKDICQKDLGRALTYVHQQPIAQGPSLYLVSSFYVHALWASSSLKSPARLLHFPFRFGSYDPLFFRFQ